MAQAAAAAGTGMSVVGNYYQGQTTGEAADYNATIDTQNAELSIQQAAEQERRQRATAAMHIGSQTAAYGANGVQSDGSPLDALGASAANAELDALTIRHQGEVKSNQYLNQAAFERFRGEAARIGGSIGAAGAGALGASKAMGMSGSGGEGESSNIEDGAD